MDKVEELHKQVAVDLQERLREIYPRRTVKVYRLWRICDEDDQDVVVAVAARITKGAGPQ